MGLVDAERCNYHRVCEYVYASPHSPRENRPYIRQTTNARIPSEPQIFDGQLERRRRRRRNLGRGLIIKYA